MVLLYQDVVELAAIAQQRGEAIHREIGFEFESQMPRSLGEGGIRSISLRNGLTLHILNSKSRQTIRWEKQHGANFPLVAKFYLSGSSRVLTKGPALTSVKADYAEMPGCQYLYHLPEITEVENWPSDQWHRVVMICATADYFHSFGWSEVLLVPALQQLLEGDESQRFHQSLGPISPTINQVLEQIVQSPYQSAMQQLYLEGKALELLTLQFAQWSEMPPSESTRWLSKYELEKLHMAKAILTCDVSTPPTLAELAQQVELNEYRLKQGFRQVFGTTPFGYLHHCRMQQAQHLLRNSNLTIAGVAARVGYRNPEAFSTAFRRKFAVSPKAYQLGKNS
ncbi:MAG: AraC family transcriptional regulator [Cyanobacteria bacterium P01_H01_bin.153]